MTNAEKMPVLFIGHGSPMNAVEDNDYTRNWSKIADMIPQPKAILSVSAHWFTRGARIADSEKPKMVYDMYGFPEELYQTKYDAAGAPDFARRTKALIKSDVLIDNSWGIDHGTWSVLCKMYPHADIPVFQLSVDSNAPAETHFGIGQDINSLRDEGVLILGSGNIVHNLSKVNWDMEGGYQWAYDFDSYIKDRIVKKRFDDVVGYRNAGRSAESAVHTPDHFYPLLYILGASRHEDKAEVFNEACTLGSISMTCYLFK